jgi:hypothetical protein
MQRLRGVIVGGESIELAKSQYVFKDQYNFCRQANGHSFARIWVGSTWNM